MLRSLGSNEESASKWRLRRRVSSHIIIVKLREGGKPELRSSREGEQDTTVKN